MVRTVADRALAPTRDALEEIGDMMILAGIAFNHVFTRTLLATHPEIDLIR